MIVAKSLIAKRIYATDAIIQSKYEDHEIVIVSTLVALDYKHMTTLRGKCTAPANGYSAGHCFGTPNENKRGYNAYLYDTDVTTTTVLRDYYMTNPIQQLKCIIAKLLGMSCDASVLDLVEVNRYNEIDAKIVGVISAAPAFEGRPAFASIVPSVSPQEVVGKEAWGYSYDFDKQMVVRWRGKITDYVIYRFFHGTMLVTARGIVVVPEDDMRFKPGMSGSPVFLV